MPSPSRPSPRLMESTHHSLITDGVPEQEQTLGAFSPFWVLFTGNLGLPTWLIGILIAAMGLSFTTAMIVMLVGALIGSMLPALTATMGPLTRLSQMEAGRFSLGSTGKKLPALLNWVGSIGWDVINNVVSVTAIISLCGKYGINTPFWLVLGVLVLAQMIIGLYGHHLVQKSSKYSGILLALFFIASGIVAMRHTGIVSAPATASFHDILSAFLLVVIYNSASWTTYTADYTRYLPKETPALAVFGGIFLAIFLSLFGLAFFGFMTAAVVTDQSPQGIMTALMGLMGPYAPLALVLLGFSAIPANAINDNSAAYCLISAGIKLPRTITAVFGAVLGYILCLVASSSFVDFFQNFLLLFAHWVTPWAAILLLHWYRVGRHDRTTPSGITTGCVIFVLVSVLSVLLFSSNPLYTGPVAAKLGGLDIGPYVGFAVASAIYYIALKARKSAIF